MYIIKENDTVYFARAAGFLTQNVSVDSGLAVTPENACVWKAPNDDNIMVMASRRSAAVDQIRYDPEIFSGEVTFDRIITEFMPKLKRVFARFGKLDKDGDFTSSFALAQNGKVFILTIIGFCEEVTDFATAGYCAELALTTLRLTQGKSPAERFVLLKKMLDDNSADRDTTLTVMDTKTFNLYLIK